MRLASFSLAALATVALSGTASAQNFYQGTFARPGLSVTISGGTSFASPYSYSRPFYKPVYRPQVYRPQYYNSHYYQPRPRYYVPGHYDYHNGHYDYHPGHYHRSPYHRH